MSDTNATPTEQINTDAGAQQNTDAQPAVAPESVTTENTDAQKTEQEAPKSAPENYEFVMPEGMTVNEEAAAEFSAIAKAHNLSQEDAQKFADLGAKLVSQAAEAQRQAMANAAQQWRDQALADKEFGGAALTENLALAERAINQFNPELYSFLQSTGLGNHPEFIRFAVRVGKSISEDRIETGGDANPGAGIDPAKLLFPTMN